MYTRQNLKRISTAASWTAVLLCLLVAGLVGFGKLQGYELLSVQSDSMRPVINTGDAVLADQSQRIPQPGDIVSYASPKDPTVILTHRVVSFDGQKGIFIAQGDNTSAPDPAAPVRNIVGTVRYSVPWAGAMLDFFRSPVGLILALYVPAAGIIIGEIRRLSQHFSGLGPDRYIHHRYYQP